MDRPLLERKRVPDSGSAGRPSIDAEGRFSGYASLFGIPDLGRDVVLPGAFATSLAKRGADGVRLLWQHDPGEPIGRWLTIAEDRRGLRVVGALNLAVGRAREVHALMRDGAIDGLSIGYRVVRSKTDPRAGLRRLAEIDLWEISVVTFPMLPQARIGDVKHGRDPAMSQASLSQITPSRRLASALRRLAAEIAPPPGGSA
jgi:HK97 family phage prohead protease